MKAPTIFAITTFQVGFSMVFCGCFDFSGTYFNVVLFTSFGFSDSSASNMSAKFDFLINKNWKKENIYKYERKKISFDTYSFDTAPARKLSKSFSS